MVLYCTGEAPSYTKKQRGTAKSGDTVAALPSIRPVALRRPVLFLDQASVFQPLADAAFIDMRGHVIRMRNQLRMRVAHRDAKANGR